MALKRYLNQNWFSLHVPNYNIRIFNLCNRMCWETVPLTAMSVRYITFFEFKPCLAMFQHIAAGVFTCNYRLTDISTSTAVIFLWNEATLSDSFLVLHYDSFLCHDVIVLSHATVRKPWWHCYKDLMSSEAVLVPFIYVNTYWYIGHWA